ncbi:MAG: ABC transporter ATP-binding protein [Lachnospiraceae bacterium]|nr:ABC transporter ATP-binding protein [Lachnospiraceae bacterium]
MAETPGYILKIKNLDYSYDNRNNVLTNINLEIKNGEKIAILGANGAGKSTLFLNMNGVYNSRNGEIFFSGTKITRKNINTLRKNVGYVFQEPDSQIVGTTVLNEVSFGLVNLGLPENEIRKRTIGILKEMGLYNYKDKPPHYLSGGEKKRVAIAGVIAMQPEIILFDEPMAPLDHKNSLIFENILAKLENEGKTIIISTHNTDFAYKWASRIIVLEKGSIIADNEPLKIFTSDEILKRTNIGKPMLLQIYEIIKKKYSKDLNNYNSAPKSINEFDKWFKHL